MGTVTNKNNNGAVLTPSNKHYHTNVVMLPNPATYSLHKLQGQFLGTHFVISSLNFCKVLMDFSSWGTNTDVFAK